MAKLIALIAIHAIVLGAPERRDAQGVVVGKSTLREVAPGEAFKCDANVAEDLLARGAARAPVDESGPAPAEPPAPPPPPPPPPPTP